MSFIEVKNLTKRFVTGELSITANRDINFNIEKGEFVVVVGPSGAGKSTLLNILGGMESPSEGSIIIDGKDISTYSPRELTEYRRTQMGFVFQFYNLISNLTALENVELAAQIAEDPFESKSVLEDVGLGGRLNNFPSQLSGGEQQRVAIARALVKRPKLLLCDEPTGALDYKTGKQVLKILQETVKNSGTTVIVITHNQALTPMANRIIEINDGTIRNMRMNENPMLIDDISW